MTKLKKIKPSATMDRTPFVAPGSKRTLEFIKLLDEQLAKIKKEEIEHPLNKVMEE